MRLSDFDYRLPEELIAQEPLPERTGSRLMVLEPALGRFSDHHFTELVDHVDAGDLVVFNDTRVIPARLLGRKQSGGQVEVLVERVIDDRTLLAQLRASKTPKPGSRLQLEGAIDCEMLRREGDMFILWQEQGSWLELLERHGHVPLPPYIRRADARADRERYQTVYARKPGAVAAPTAGLHFDAAKIAALEARGAITTQVTLHVGAGTFQPVRGENLDDHVMHAELMEVTPEVCDLVEQTHARRKRVIAIGTTVVRCLESAWATGRLRPMRGESTLFIKPGYEFRVVDAMLTNFHLPRSTLLVMISAFAGTDLVRRAYAHAVREQYRFFSYGDAMFIAGRGGRSA
ncbi:MAG: tRNA preQ1(34) S-adenosylmethionine ribosyltransferase-isomerase QueA [Gammaproteobacteria bacterium]|nr:tRNA preQ1(34) S-adenosylmethionine ribosyltransferase-isomerase QueA [Gammaproteobacteria bacterium]